MALCFLQEKGRRESEGPKSRRRPGGRSPTSAEKRMSFESTSSLPEVSGRQAEGGRCRSARSTWSAGGASRHGLSCWARGDRFPPPRPGLFTPLGSLSGL